MLQDALATMLDKRFRHLPIVEKDAILGLLDVVQLLQGAVKAQMQAAGQAPPVRVVHAQFQSLHTSERHVSRCLCCVGFFFGGGGGVVFCFALSTPKRKLTHTRADTRVLAANQPTNANTTGGAHDSLAKVQQVFPPGTPQGAVQSVVSVRAKCGSPAAAAAQAGAAHA